MVWLIGLSLGSLNRLQDRPLAEAASAPGYAGYAMLAADFHVHSFPGDGTLFPWHIAVEAQRRGLNVVALTNHNHMLESRVASIARSWMREDVIVLPGEEVTSPGFHLAAVGIDHPVRWSRSAREVIAAVHASGGVAIAAHPGKGYSEGYDAEALRELDGVEAAHGATDARTRERLEIEAFYAHARAVKPSIASIGSSDFHREAPLGLSRTYVFVEERSRAGAIDAIRRGRTAACDGTGTVKGGQPWASLAESSCLAAMERARLSPARAGGPLNAFAVGCALVGLAALVFSRRST